MDEKQEFKMNENNCFIEFIVLIVLLSKYCITEPLVKAADDNALGKNEATTNYKEPENFFEKLNNEQKKQAEEALNILKNITGLQDITLENLLQFLELREWNGETVDFVEQQQEDEWDEIRIHERNREKINSLLAVVKSSTPSLKKITQKQFIDVLNRLGRNGFLKYENTEDSARFCFDVYKNSDKIGVNVGLTEDLIALVILQIILNPGYQYGQEIKDTDIEAEIKRFTNWDGGLGKHIKKVKRNLINEKVFNERFALNQDIYNTLRRLSFNETEEGKLKRDNYIEESINGLAHHKAKVEIGFWPLVTLCAIICLREEGKDKKYSGIKLTDNAIIEKIKGLGFQNECNDLKKWLAVLQYEGLINDSRIITAEIVSSGELKVNQICDVGYGPTPVYLSCKMLVLFYGIYKLREKSLDEKPYEKGIVDYLKTQLPGIDLIIGKYENNKNSKGQRIKFKEYSSVKEGLFAQGLIDDKLNIVVKDVFKTEFIIRDSSLLKSDGEEGSDSKKIRSIIEDIQKDTQWNIDIINVQGYAEAPQERSKLLLPESIDDYGEILNKYFLSETEMGKLVGRNKTPHVPALMDGQRHLWKYFKSYKEKGILNKEGKLYQKLICFTYRSLLEDKILFEGSAYNIMKVILQKKTFDSKLRDIHEFDQIIAGCLPEKVFQNTPDRIYDCQEPEFRIRRSDDQSEGKVKELLYILEYVQSERGRIIELIKEWEPDQANDGEDTNDQLKEIIIDGLLRDFLQEDEKILREKGNDLVISIYGIDIVELLSKKEDKQKKAIEDWVIKYRDRLCGSNRGVNNTHEYLATIREEIDARIVKFINSNQISSKGLKRYKANSKIKLQRCSSILIDKAAKKIELTTFVDRLDCFADDNISNKLDVLKKLLLSEDAIDDKNLISLYDAIEEKNDKIQSEIDVYIDNSQYLNEIPFLEKRVNKEKEYKLNEHNKQIDTRNRELKEAQFVLLEGLYQYVKE